MNGSCFQCHGKCQWRSQTKPKWRRPRMLLLIKKNHLILMRKKNKLLKWKRKRVYQRLRRQLPARQEKIRQIEHPDPLGRSRRATKPSSLLCSSLPRVWPKLYFNGTRISNRLHQSIKKKIDKTLKFTRHNNQNQTK